MFTKHFFKRLIVFMMMIALGMAGILLVTHYDESQKEAPSAKVTPDPKAAPCKTGAKC